MTAVSRPASGRGLRLLVAALPLALAGFGCNQEVATAPEMLRVAVRAPVGGDNPFALPDAAFIAITGEGPGVPQDTYVQVAPYVPGGTLSLPELPFGPQRQLRVEIWSQDQNGMPAPPILGRGRTVPVDVTTTSAGKVLPAYVTRVNRFSSAVDDAGVKAKTDARIGAATALLADGQVLFIGGGLLEPGAKDAFDPQNYAKFVADVVHYEPNSRQVFTAGAKLQKPRAFHAVATGRNVVAIAGGYELDGDVAKPLKSMEFYDIAATQVQTSLAPVSDLVFARAHAQVVQMFDNEDFFLVLGGKGDTPCTTEGKRQGDDGPCEIGGAGDKVCQAEIPCAANTWEIWHPVHGNIAQGLLNDPRWNHAVVRLPNPGGGFAVLVGGENAGGTLATFEVVQFTDKYGGKVSQKNSPCPEAGCNSPNDCACPADGLLYWQPLTGGLRGARTLPGAVFVAVQQEATLHRHIYMVGGFADTARTLPLDRVDIFDIGKGDYIDCVGDEKRCVDKGFRMKEKRGAPMIAASSIGPRPGQVLIAGGSTSDVTKHHTSAEFIYFPDLNDAGTLSFVDVENPLPAARGLGSAIALTTGHILLGGGIGGTDGVTPQTDLLLWNPF